MDFGCLGCISYIFRFIRYEFRSNFENLNRHLTTVRFLSEIQAIYIGFFLGKESLMFLKSTIMDWQLLQINLLQAAMQLNSINNNILVLHNQVRRVLRRARRRRQRTVWVRPWLQRRAELGQYDRLMTELEMEDPAGYRNFIRMDRHLFSELVDVLTPRIQRNTINYRKGLQPA